MKRPGLTGGRGCAWLSVYRLSSRRGTHPTLAPTHGDDIRKRFGARVRQLRSERGWSQEAFADRAGLHRTYVGSVERGEQNLSLVNIEKVAATLGVSLAELFAPFKDRPSSPA
jgi:ribosome-binding protein aMBF1 (putative translation factor)